MGTNNDEKEDKWKTFGTNFIYGIIILVLSVIVGTYFIYISRLADSGIFSIFTENEITPKLTKILESGDCIWNYNFLKYDINQDKHIKWIIEKTDNIWDHYFTSIIKETINPVFWLLKNLNLKNKGWEFFSILSLFYLLTTALMSGIIFFISLIIFLVALVKVPINILFREEDKSLFQKLCTIPLFILSCCIFPILGLIVLIYFFYIVNKMNEGLTYLSLLTNIIKYKFMAILILFLIILCSTIGTSFGWNYTIILIPILIYIIKNYYKPPIPEEPFICNEINIGEKIKSNIKTEMK